MASLAATAPDLSDAPRLRLLAAGPGSLASGSSAPFPSGRGARPALRLLGGSEPEDDYRVLVVGRDSERRATVLRELGATMPASARFEVADVLWEVLGRAPASRVVILSDDLEEVSAESLARMIRRRHPGLPVISLDAPESSAQASAST